jgi:4-azaleucine resistance transporter AzlC
VKITPLPPLPTGRQALLKGGWGDYVATLKKSMNKNGFREGVKAALPIVLGYLPVGITFGILARKAGLTSFEVGLMSLLVYAGASQFLAVEMISKGIPNFSIILATFFINLRHILMSSNLSVYLRNVRIPILGLLSAQMTDESYAVAISKLPWMSNRPHYLLGLQIISQLAWVAGSVVGALFSSLATSTGWGLPFALPALFICLLVLQIKNAHHFWVMVIAGIISVFFKWALPGNWYILLTALFASGMGMMIERVWRKNS